MRGISVLNDVKLTLPADAVREWRCRGKLTACLMVKLRFRLVKLPRSRTLHVALENGSDLHVNERQKIRHYHGSSTGE